MNKEQKKVIDEIKYNFDDNEFTKKDKNQFCSTVFSSPYDNRFNMVNLLNNYKQVDCYGKIHNNKLPDGEKYKMDVIYLVLNLYQDF